MRTLRKLIKDNEVWMSTGYVCFCEVNSPVCTRIPVMNLNLKELATFYREREWWIEDGDLCVCKGK